MANASAAGEVRIGIIGTDNTHAYPFTALLNGWADDVPIPTVLPNGTPVADMYLWATYLRQQVQDNAGDVPIAGARVTALWSEDASEAELLARACGIDTICDTPDKACHNVDAVMVLSERPETHLPYARMSLERGLPTYVDKPLAENITTGQQIFDLAKQHNTACYTGSALRWSPSLLAGRDYTRTRYGLPRAIYVPCPLGLELYGIHAMELVNAFMGHDAATVQAIGCQDRQVVLLEYNDGRTAVFEHLNFVTWPAYSAVLYGQRWDYRVVHDDIGATFHALLRNFVDVARGAQPPVPSQESLRLIHIVTTAQHALDTGQTIHLDAGDAESAAKNARGY